MPKADMVWRPIGDPQLVTPQLRDLLEKKLKIDESSATTHVRIDKDWTSYLQALVDMDVPGSASLLAAVQHYEVVEVSMRPRL